MTQRAGRPAEKKFELLCSQHDITCNSSNQDDFGWDFVLDIPDMTTHTIAADTTPPTRQALVQIKSTTSNNLRVRLKLSNALNLSNLQLPCFLVLFQKSKQNDCRIYARHFWKELMEHSLKRARLASVEGAKLHKRFMTVSFSAHDEHSDDLISWIVSCVRGLAANYSTEKANLYNTLGYEKSGFRGKATINLTRGIEDLLDHQLGLTQSLPVSYMKLTDTRFGIEAPIPIVEESEGSIAIQPNPIEGFRILLRSNSGVAFSISATLTVPSIPGIRIEDSKFRLHSWMFDAVVSQEGKNAITLNKSINDRMSLIRLVKLVKFLSWQRESIDLKLLRQGSLLWAATLSIQASSHADCFLRLSKYATTLKMVLDQSGGDSPELSLDDLYASKESLLIFDAVVTDEDVQIKLEMIDPIPDPSVLTSALGYVNVTVANLYFFVIFRAIVSVRRDDDYHIELDFGVRTWLDCFVSRDLPRAKQHCVQNYERHVRNSDEKCIFLGNMRDPNPEP